ncbi:dihydrofolate reductase family protein [Microbacterium sp. AZCO]|uniref:dihydrofolate reductase family protein n=1 Tax=Microbacterium sp. AZCO TaxID=3142976 RepID=UPI0031F35565
MGRLIVVQFITLDGVVEDPDGSDGTPFGGWAMRFGPQGVAGDKFRLGGILQSGVLLFGRRTWEHFSTLWPRRDDEFSRAMNRAAKAVVTSRPIDPDQWTNSAAVPAPLDDWVTGTLASRDIVVIGSGSVIAQLREANLIDEYRLLTFPLATGAGRTLFPDAAELALRSVEHVGPACLTIFSTRVPLPVSAT